MRRFRYGEASRAGCGKLQSSWLKKSGGFPARARKPLNMKISLDSLHSQFHLLLPHSMTIHIDHRTMFPLTQAVRDLDATTNDWNAEPRIYPPDSFDLGSAATGAYLWSLALVWNMSGFHLSAPSVPVCCLLDGGC